VNPHPNPPGLCASRARPTRRCLARRPSTIGLLLSSLAVHDGHPRKHAEAQASASLFDWCSFGPSAQLAATVRSRSSSSVSGAVGGGCGLGDGYMKASEFRDGLATSPPVIRRDNRRGGASRARHSRAAPRTTRCSRAGPIAGDPLAARGWPPQLRYRQPQTRFGLVACRDCTETLAKLVQGRYRRVAPGDRNPPCR